MITRFTRLYADADGDSHFQDVDRELNLVEFAPRAPQLFLSEPSSVTQFSFFAAPAGWKSDFHPSPSRNLFILASGEWEVTASDGEARRFASGNVLLVEDTTGRGHTSRVISAEDSLAVLVKLPDC
jgi:hypothetical protein